jgi:hypothetical protein
MTDMTSKEIEAVHSTIEMELHPCASQERASEIACFVRGLLLESLKYDTGIGTTPGMWEMVSEALNGEKLPESLNAAIYALAEGRATVVLKQGAEQ